MVLPLSAAVGLSWQKFRDVLAKKYTDISVLSIAANGKDMSFSSDTGMAERLDSRSETSGWRGEKQP